jgi:hypothetical protein
MVCPPRGLHHEQATETLRAYLTDARFTRQTPLATWPGERERGSRAKPRGPWVEWNPVQGVTLYRTDRHGRYGYVLPVGTDALTIFDLKHGTEIGRPNLPDRTLPFDENWGSAQLEHLRETLREAGNEIPVKPDFPDHFPVIRQFATTATDRLVIVLWRPDAIVSTERAETYSGHNIRVFTLRGEPVPPDPLDFLWDRVIHADKEQVILWGYDRDVEEFTLIWCERSELPSVLLSFPSQPSPL